jgi:hypothetical protein
MDNKLQLAGSRVEKVILNSWEIVELSEDVGLSEMRLSLATSLINCVRDLRICNRSLSVIPPDPQTSKEIFDFALKAIRPQVGSILL